MSTPDMHASRSRKATRRTFLKATGAAAATAALGPILLGAENKSGSRLPVLGTGEFQYEPIHGWGEVPEHIVWGETHGVCVDEDGLIYVKHRSTAKEPMDAIAVFDAGGKFVRSFGKEYHGGGHGIDIRKEGGEEFLYLCDMKNGIVAKSTLQGAQVWKQGAPQEPGIYENPKNRFVPTNVAFAPDGGFYVGDGYGSHYIHHYDTGGRWIRTWGGAGTEPGKMRTPHGLWLDDRPGREPSLVVADRATARLQYFTLDGRHLSVNTDVSFPAHFDIRGDVLLCPDLHARVTLFDRDNKVIAHLGYDPEWTKKALNGFKMRGDPKQWETGRFIHPHDACFDRNGNIFVVEWVATGRVTKLRKVA